VTTIDLNEENIAEICNKEHSPKEFEYLVTSHQIEVRQHVARNPYLPMRFAWWMADDVYQEVRAALASNQVVDLEILQSLLKETNLAVLAGLASNIKLPEVHLRALGEHRSYLVRERVAANTSTPLDLLVALGRDEVWGVRRSVASNQKSSVDTLKLLAKDSTYEVLQAIAQNEFSTPEILESLLEFSNKSDLEVDSLRKVCLTNPSFLESNALAIYKEAMNSGDDPEDENLIHSSDVRIAIAQRRNLSDSFIELVMKDPYSIVRGWLARNECVKDSYLAQLALDSDQSVRSDVVKNPNASELTKVSAILLGIDQDEQ
jgi:hypothetical protein